MAFLNIFLHVKAYTRIVKDNKQCLVQDLSDLDTSDKGLSDNIECVSLYR